MLIVGMTNRVEAIDPAILRNGRFDYILEVKPANKEAILGTWHSYFSKLPCKDDLDFDNVASALENHPLSDVKFFVDECAKFAAVNDKEKIDQECFEIALKSSSLNKAKLSENSVNVGFIK